LTYRSGSRTIGILCTIAVLDSLPLAAADQDQELAVLVDNIGRTSAFTMVRAQNDTSLVFRLAGIKIRWLECSFAEAELQDPPGCRLPLDVPTVIVKILPQGEVKRWILSPNVLGFSQDRDTFIFLSRVEFLAVKTGVAKSVILGHAMAHEVGHALLGPGHPADGLMRNRLRIEEWKLAEKGELQFSSNETEQIRQRIRILRKVP
jgi:hypothetical protein